MRGGLRRRPRCCRRSSRRRRCSGTGRGFRACEWRWAYSIRQLRLDDLAFEVAVGVADAEVADQLLGDRRAALDRFAGFEVLERGAQRCPRGRARRAGRSAGPRSRPSPAAGSCGMRSIATGVRASSEAITPSLLPSAGVEAELPPLSIGLQEASEGALAATSSTQEVMATTAIAGTTRAADAEQTAACRPAPPRRLAGVGDCAASSRTGYFAAAPGPPVGQACVSPVEWLWTIPSTSIWLGITIGAAVAGVDVGVGEGDVGDPAARLPRSRSGRRS